MKKLIADAGSTKTAWATLVNGKMQRTLQGNGINPMTMSESEINNFLSIQIAPLLKDEAPQEIWFYGAGCKDEAKERMMKLLKQYAPTSDIYIHSDIIGAARATQGTSEGIVCILGTGSNSCYYDGTNICKNISPLGFILGDEGSGASLGKLLIGETIKGELTYLKETFYNEMGITESDIIERVYRKPFPNKFLASLTPFIYQHRDDKVVHNLVVKEFERFIDRNVSHYDNYKELPISFVGSIAWWFKEELMEALINKNCKLGTIIQKPLEGLLEFHSKI